MTPPPMLPPESEEPLWYDRAGLFADIRRGFALDWAGHHGANHWGRVRRHALDIARARRRASGCISTPGSTPTMPVTRPAS